MTSAKKAMTKPKMKGNDTVSKKPKTPKGMSKATNCTID